jgi:hypothetical protein
MRKKKHTKDEVNKDDSKEIIERLIPPSEDAKDKDPEKTKKRKGVPYKKRTQEPNEDSLNLEIARQKTVEETWGQKDGKVDAFTKGKSTAILRIFIAFIIIAGGWGLWSLYHTQRNNEDELAALKDSLDKKVKQKLTLEKEIVIASEMIEQYLRASSISEKCKYIYQAELFKNDIESYYKSNQGLNSISDFKIKGILPVTLNGEELLEVVIKYEDLIGEKYRSYYVRRDSAGEYKIDWKADVIFQDNDVIAFQKSRSSKATSFKFEVKRISLMKTYDWAFKNLDFTAHALETPFDENIIWGLQSRHEIGMYNWGFSDKEYNVFRLDIPDSPIVFWGYVKKGSTVEQEMFRCIEEDIRMRILSHNIKHEFILKVRFLEDSPAENSQYVLIEELEATKWVNTEE